MCKLFFFWIPSVRRTICCHFHENRCYFIFSTLYNLNIYLWPLKPHNFRTARCIWKIITFLESLHQAGWFDLFESDIQALLIFDPLITLLGNFDAPYLKLLNDASVASACFYVRTCRRVRNSKKIATIRDFHLPGSFLCLSTRLKQFLPHHVLPHHHTTNSYEPIRFLQVSQNRLINIHRKSLKHISQSALFGFSKNIGHDQIWYENSVVFKTVQWLFMIKERGHVNFVTLWIPWWKYSFK